MDEIVMKPIGVIRTEFNGCGETPRQGLGKEMHPGCLEILEEFMEAMRDVEEGDWYIVTFYFHKSQGYRLTTTSKRSGRALGVFSTRSPYRPNGIGISVIRFTKIEGNRFEFAGADMLDGTPVLDLKPHEAGYCCGRGVL